VNLCGISLKGAEVNGFLPRLRVFLKIFLQQQTTDYPVAPEGFRGAKKQYKPPVSSQRAWQGLNIAR